MVRAEHHVDRPSCANGEGNPGTLQLRPGSKQCRCGACDRYFWSVAAFDRHQRLGPDGSVVCRDPLALGMVQNERGYWVTMLRDRSAVDHFRDWRELESAEGRD
jgi:hypothetical protein